MIQDILNQNTYNVYIANKFGLEAAVYLSAVVFYQNNYVFSKLEFALDRDFISKITTLSFESQRNIDKLFSKLGVFNFNLTGDLSIDYEKYMALFDVDNEKVLLDVSNKVLKKKTKSDIIKDELKSLIKTDNGELRDAYAAWIDSVFAKQGWMSKKSVELGQKLIDSFSGRNLDLAIKILDIASIGGYRDIQWAINSYKENVKDNIINYSNNKEFEVNKKITFAQEVF